MRAPDFWWRPAGAAAWALAPLGAVVGGIAARRMGEPATARVDVPVVCVGNFVVGGGGKTPTVIAIARAAAAAGLAPAILSRGYGGSAAGPLRVDPARHRSAEVGDEPLVLARVAPVYVGRDRTASAAMAVAEGAGFLVMDDGMQSPALHRDVVLAVVDRATGVGNGLCLPAGPLRAPLAAQASGVDAVLVVGTTAGLGPIGRGEPAHAVAAVMPRGAAVLTGTLVPADTGELRGLAVLAFAGIARPEKFFASLAAVGADIVERRAFADHHPFGEGEAQRLIERCDARGLVPVTTEKDLVRLAGGAARRALADRCRVLAVRLAVDQPRAVDAMVSLARQRARERREAGG